MIQMMPVGPKRKKAMPVTWPDRAWGIRPILRRIRALVTVNRGCDPSKTRAIRIAASRDATSIHVVV
jgi:hypothetical protein